MNDEQRAKHRAAVRRFYERHPERVKARAKAWEQANPERASERKRAYREANRERLLAYDRARHKEHHAQRRSQLDIYRAQNRAHAARRRAAMAQVTCDRHPTCVSIDFEALYVASVGGCYLCGSPLSRETVHFDHIVPVSKGGPHCAFNLRPACAPCNLSKKDKLPAILPSDLLAEWPELARAY